MNDQTITTELDFEWSDDTPIWPRMVGAMRDIIEVAKSDRNQGQNFNFRGIDTTINAVGPRLRRHGIFLLTQAEAPNMETYTTSKGTVMNHCVVQVCFQFVAPDGSVVECCTIGEASDAGDKAVPKALSVALRIALLQVFCIPTDSDDPDAESHQRAAEAPPGPTPEEEQSARDRGFDSHQAMTEAWTDLREASRALPDGEAKAHIKAWTKDRGVVWGTFNFATFTAWDEMLSHVNKDGTWRKGYEVPALEAGEAE